VSQERDQEAEPSLLHVLQPDEELYVQARAIGAVIGVTDRRLVVTTGGRVTMDVAYGELRRVQFDIEREHPATFVIVPDSPATPPEVLSIPESDYENAGHVLAVIGRRLSDGI
jgi:hypothetical protein